MIFLVKRNKDFIYLDTFIWDTDKKCKKEYKPIDFPPLTEEQNVKTPKRVPINKNAQIPWNTETSTWQTYKLYMYNIL